MTCPPALIPLHLFNGEIAGKVFDAASGGEIAGARVMAKRVGGIVGFATVTDINGGYSVPNLSAGEYSVQASAGNNEGVRRRVVVDDDTANRDFFVIGEGGVGEGGGEGGGEGDGEGAGAAVGEGEGSSEGSGDEGQDDAGCAAAISGSRGGVGFASGSVGDLVLLTMTVLALGGVARRRPHSQS